MAYCGYDLCTAEQYCCGINQCCNNSFLKIYIGGGLGVFIFLVLFWFFYRIHRRRVTTKKTIVYQGISEDGEPLLRSEDDKLILVPE